MEEEVPWAHLTIHEIELSLLMTLRRACPACDWTRRVEYDLLDDNFVRSAVEEVKYKTLSVFHHQIDVALHHAHCAGTYGVLPHVLPHAIARAVVIAFTRRQRETLRGMVLDSSIASVLGSCANGSDVAVLLAQYRTRLQFEGAYCV
jgi:hypothetical protein